ncbi:TetR family transcriptional regulator [Luteolibacter flavescens]|uniref:TetR family transcriptional regulator n=1 Tax=Luteolibacter flavescens TaxID=1859460 RepID=A0ABT3FK77_9BACT|nr:TetR family transcriptional regulator [Luteolibacter flavescens]MCW1883405.1 TetR family transcriptional regulator [Luteolibacter flavescens]
MARKTKEDTQKTITAILDAAEQVFCIHGVAKATIAQIADAAGVSKGAVYGHFDDKIEVCIAVCERGVADLRLAMSSPVPGKPLESLYRWGMEHMRLFNDSKSYRNVGEILWMKCERSPEFERIHRIREIWEEKAFRFVEKCIRRAIATGDLPPGTDPELSNLYLHSVLDGLMATCYYTDRISPDKIMEHTGRMLRMGLLSISRLMWDEVNIPEDRFFQTLRRGNVALKK